MTEQMDDRYDVVVIGGGAAGLSGALMLGRARRSVLVVDAGQPRNAPAAGVHGLLGHDGVPPAELTARGREEVRRYGGHLVDGEVVGASVLPDPSPAGDRFAVTLADGRSVAARRLLVTTGLVDELPDVPGLRERWGHDVLHCPYCHGWEVRDQAIGVLASGPMSVHQVLLFRQWSDDVVFFTHDQPALDVEQAERLAARGIRVVEGEVAAVEVREDRLVGLRLRDGTLHEREAVAVATRMVARSALLSGLGLVPTQNPMGEFVASDELGRSEVPGVWLAGNVTDMSAQVGAAAARGAFAAAQINADLVVEDTDLAVALLRAEAEPVAG